ncbi:MULTISPECIES: glycosyltransferase family 8 protein [unclassified Mesorhizobium]|uniref:glycosyltransferase family 8 protein n=1 Tax=unclassified Mesorhizobium TaxID=325217 RepID=UPI001CCE5E4C|nr:MULTISPECIES: glycosyltransferase family 8 protein [unclassified Mesorhizobium]MBZ9740108.1 glycosyltransferase family 8 protein [Mesorhizobium sp. CO1-1-4]MBZ9803225.1 glycosyltransferase family 8 protein [Mesorhizobium sp. ES1-6]
MTTCLSVAPTCLSVAPTCLSVALCVDGGNVDQAAVTIASVLEHLSPGPPLTFHVFHDAPPSRRSRRLERLRVDPHRVFVRYVENRFRDMARFDHVTPAALLRLQLGEFLPDLDRVLYLDADILAVADIRPLLATDLGGAVAGAVRDLGLHAALAEEAATGRPDHVLHVRDALGWDPDDFTYVNSGMLLLNLAALRRERFGERAGQLVLDHPHRFRWRDQDAINLLLRGRVALLDPRWNTMVWLLEREPRRHYVDMAAAALQRRDPWLLHFSGATKPWDSLVDIPDYRRWWRAAIRTSPLWGLSWVRLLLATAVASACGAIRRERRRLRARLLSSSSTR